MAARAALAAFLGCAFSGAVLGREIRDSTPTPCKAEYDKSFISEAANKYIENVPSGQAKPRLLLLLGGSGAGKGTFIRKISAAGFPSKDYVMHGIDDYLGMLPEWKETEADTAAVYKDAADGCYGGAIPIAKAAQKTMIEKKMNVIYEETGKNLDRVLKRVVPPFRDAGYTITIALIDCTVDTAKARAEGRFLDEGRYSAPDYVEGTFKGVFSNYVTLRQKDFVSEAIYCNNGCTSKDCMRCWSDGDPKAESIMPGDAILHSKVEYLSSESAPRDEF
eukprot:CAMPEP_0197886686 /NCGR_PEP_ID=MMETSP1439-20131203/17276_1 /TAXON_ID=66791 /ORGANISM="Gonyaulax spinifera, Strain CCMP409" /LENGTH=276 /DNA_ID=CAMNT_0043506493 /DNA_START=66 /DNA_END=896 /DNA_ORIENTATION=+